MASVTLSVDDRFKEKIKQFLWINWSKIAKEETKKKLIFEKYMKTKEVSDEEWKFCEKIDWHPVDELPLKEEFVKKLKKIKEERPIKLKSVSEIFE